MSKQTISLSADRTHAVEGEVVTVSWDCGVPDSVTLRIDNGYKTTLIHLPDSGTRAILIEKSKGKTTLQLTAVIGTRKEHKELSVRVKNLKVIRPREATRRTSRKRFSMSDFSFKRLWQQIKVAVVGLWRKLEYGWRTMPPKTKRIYKFLLILLAAMWISAMGQSRGYKAGYEQGIKDRATVEQTYGPSAI